MNIVNLITIGTELSKHFLKSSKLRKIDYESEKRRIQQGKKQRLLLLAFILRKKRRQMFKRSCWVSPELLLSEHGKFWEITVPVLSDEKFFMKFRMTRQVFHELCDDVRPYIEKKDTNFRQAIPVGKRVAIALTVLKGCIDYGTVADLFGVGKSTVGCLLLQFCEALNDNFINLIKFPAMEEERQEIANNFLRKWQFYDCFGALDGTHIPILPPENEAAEYYNYKSFHSINVLAMVDDKYRFTYVNTGAPGRCNDASVFRRGALFDLFDDTDGEPIESTKFHIIADGAFPLLTWLMKPFPQTPSIPLMQKNYNYRLSSARMCIENAFGRLKARWRILSRRPDVHIKTMKAIIKACIILYNICENSNLKVHEEWLKELAEEEKIFYENAEEVEERSNDAVDLDEPVFAKLKRRKLAEKLYNDKVSIKK